MTHTPPPELIIDSDRRKRVLRQIAAEAYLVDRELLAITRRASTFGVLVSCIQRGGRVAITHIEVEERFRGQGRARKVLEEICTFGDTAGMCLAVTPSDTYGADPVRLTKLFASLGFYVNLAPARMFERHEPMLRDPVKLKWVMVKKKEGGDGMRDVCTPLGQPDGGDDDDGTVDAVQE